MDNPFVKILRTGPGWFGPSFLLNSILWRQPETNRFVATYLLRNTKFLTGPAVRSTSSLRHCGSLQYRPYCRESISAHARSLCEPLPQDTLPAVSPILQGPYFCSGRSLPEPPRRIRSLQYRPHCRDSISAQAVRPQGTLQDTLLAISPTLRIRIAMLHPPNL